VQPRTRDCIALFVFRELCDNHFVKISATIIAFNEEANISDAISSVLWADEVLVVDSGSSDRTREIAADLGAKVIEREWQGFSDQKQFAAESAMHDWILSIDADERVSAELADELLRIRSLPANADGYKIPRLNFYMGRALRHGGCYPDKQLRFYDRRSGRWSRRLVHESVEMMPNAKIGRLRHDILHFSIPNAAYHHRMIGERYSILNARQMFEGGRRTNILKIGLSAPSAFLRRYLFRFGFLDGLPGLVFAAFAAYHDFLKQVLLWELQAADSNEN
jgi:glycosyltransferase involved in cell wall biosynthesis